MNADMVMNRCELNQVFPGNSKVENLLRSYDWDKSAFGEPNTWHQALRYAVRFLLDSKTAIFIAWGDDSRLLYNDAYIDILGERHPSALGAPLKEVWAEVWNVVESAVERALAGEPVQFEDAHFVVTRNGHPENTWFTFSYTPLRDLDGAVLGFYCILAETTQQVLLRQKKKSETDRIYSLFERSPSFMAILEGPELTYKLTNPAYLELVGHRNLIGRSVRDVLPEIGDQGYLDLFEKVYQSGEAFNGQRLPVQLNRTSDGALETRYVDFVMQPMFDESGRIAGIFVEGYDVTDHVHVQERVLNSEQKAQHSAQLLQEERRKLIAVLEAAPVGIGFADVNGKLTIVNAENRRIWGEHPMSNEVGEYAEWKGWWADRSSKHGQAIQPEEWGLARALSGESGVNDVVEIEPFGMPGVKRTILLRATPIRSDGGVITSAVVAQTDITDRVQSEAALRESEAKFRTIADAMPQMVWSTLPDGYHDYYNEQWYQFTGVPEGTTDGEGWNDMFHPDDQSHAWKLWRRSLATGERYEIEYRLKHFTGQYRWVLGRALPIRNEEGEIIRWMGTCTDIHENKLAQVRLQEQEEKFRALAENIPQLAWLADLEGSAFWFNNRWYDFTGRDSSALEGSGWIHTLHPEFAKEVQVGLHRAITSATTWEDTFPMLRFDGVYRWFLSRAVPIRDQSGKVARWLATYTDITEQRQAADALLQMDKRKDEFLAMLAHELRNPLAPITAAASLLTAFTSDPQRLQHISKVIARQAAHLTSLVDDLLDVSRVTRGLIQLENAHVEVISMISEAIEQAKPLFDQKGHHLATEYCRGEIYVYGDKKRLVQIVANLLNNSAKYTPNGGRISIQAEVRQGYVEISVADNGIGMSEDLLNHAFELFAQGQRTPDRTQGGLGIGLALVRSLVHLHGGTIQAFSPGDGKGSTFVVSLPIYSDDTFTYPVERRTGSSRNKTGPSYRIMLVDDNEDAAETLAMYLQTTGHKVCVAHRANAALEKIGEFVPQVLLLDIGLPDMDGKDLARHVRKLPGMENVAIAAITGYGRAEEKDEIILAGVDKHFVKPVDPNMLEDWLRNAREGYDMERY